MDIFVSLHLFFRKHKLYAKFSKCEFWLSKVRFLIHVYAKGVSIDTTKIEVVTEI